MQFDPSSYMLGSIVTLIVGIVIGAGLVGICWGAGCSREDMVSKRESWDADSELKRSQAEFLDTQIAKLKPEPTGQS